MKKLPWCRIYLSTLEGETGRYGKVFQMDCVKLCCLLNGSVTPGSHTLPIEQWQYELRQSPEECADFFRIISDPDAGFESNLFCDFKVVKGTQNGGWFVTVSSKRIAAEEKDRARKRPDYENVTPLESTNDGKSPEIPRKIPGNSETEDRGQRIEDRVKEEKRKENRKKKTTTPASPAVFLGKDHSLMKRYFDGSVMTPDDVADFRPVVIGLFSRKDGSPRSERVQERILEALSKYPLEQVAMAGDVAIDKGLFDGDMDVTWPFDRYFIGMVRKDAGKFNKDEAIKEEKREAKKRYDQRFRELSATADSGNGESVGSIGQKILRKLQPV